MVKREFRVGDRVTCNMYGLGVVELITECDNDNCVWVVFDNGQKYCYMKDGKYTSKRKRTLFIIPKIKPTLQEVKNKYKELLDSVEEVEFVKGNKNHFVHAYQDHDNDCLYFGNGLNFSVNHLRYKYIKESDTKMIIEEMNNFIKTDL